MRRSHGGPAGLADSGLPPARRPTQVRVDRISFLATDGFLDAVILACVVMFLVLALGVAMLALQFSPLR